MQIVVSVIFSSADTRTRPSDGSIPWLANPDSDLVNIWITHWCCPAQS
ncbi:hypothetical protein [Marinobacter sp. BSs20148]|nr:hypothetical protein [Marinobacter sp. BSs20148]